MLWHLSFQKGFWGSFGLLKGGKMKKLLILIFMLLCFVIPAKAAEKSISKELDSFKKVTEEKSFQEYSLFDVCQRLDKVIEKLQKIIDQNEKTIGVLKQENK
jgi:hypothetical protein